MERKVSPPIISLQIQECGEHEEDQSNEAASDPSSGSKRSSYKNSPRSSFGDTTTFIPPGYIPTLTTPSCTPKLHPSPSRSPSKTSPLGVLPSAQKQTANSNQYLQVGNTSSIFKLPKPQVKLLKKTASVKQLYNSVLKSIKTIARSSGSDIIPELTKNFFENILRASDDSPKLHVTKVKVKDGTEFGRHFCSEVHAVEVTAKIKKKGINGEDEFRKYHLVVKSQPQNPEARMLLQPGHTFEKEVQMYGQVFHDMANFVRSESVITLNCKDSEVIDVPRCYYTRWAGDDNLKEDLIILENLYPQGFTFAVGQDEGLNRRHAELVIRELAKFHAISYCMKDGNNERILDRYKYLSEDSLYRDNTHDFTKRTITPVMASLAELIRSTPGYEQHYDWFIELAKNFHDIQMDMVKPKNDFAVICHGDLWLSNILFRYATSPDTGETLPVEVKFIDFQAARFASLATDLVLFLFTSVQTYLRRQMLGELVSLYYTTFLVSVRSLNVSKDIFSMEELLIEIEEHIIYGFLEGIWYLDILHHGNVPKTNSMDLYNFGDDEECMEEIVRESISSNEDEREEAELKIRERGLDLEQSESQEEKDYKAEFFELLDEVLFLMGKARSGDGRGGKKRRSLRDTSLRFHGRDEMYKGSSAKGDGRSKSICASSFAALSGDDQQSSDNLLLLGAGIAAAQHRKGSWCSGMN